MRLDQYLKYKGFFETREKARQAIENSLVFVNGKTCLKPSKNIPDNTEIRIKKVESHVSRAGEKLKAAIKHFNISPEHKICLDIGSSTGGFTEYLLKKGAKEVTAVDVGKNQMHPDLRKNPKLKLFEETDIREFHPNKKFDLIVVDVSFISIKKIIPSLKELIDHETIILWLFKPQFEAGRKFLKKGICRHPDIKMLIRETGEFLGENGLKLIEMVKIPLKGKMGNQEYFLKIKSLTEKKRP